MKTSVHVVALLSLCAVTAAPAAADAVVATVKVQNPADQPLAGIAVRGMLPLPADFAGPVGRLALRDGQKVLPTQVSVFATYPGSDAAHPVGRPEVVQLAARADLPARALKELAVVQLDAAPAADPMQPDAALGKWLAGDAPLVVEATDCYGNRYRARPLAAEALIETRQAGPVLIERVYQSILTPVAAAAEGKPALRRFLRVRAYLTLYAGESFATLSLMIHNGSIDHPNGTVYYGDIRVGVAEPMGLAVWQKSFSPAAEGEQTAADGTTWQPCPPPAKDGKLFAMPHGGAAVLRTILLPAGEAAKAALARATAAPRFVPVASQAAFSWSNPATARYGAPKYPMPLSLGETALADADRAAAGQLASPTLGWDLVYLRELPEGSSRTLGHAMPAGVAYGGMTGGGGVSYVYGARAAVTGHNGLIHLHTLLADRNWDRQWDHLFTDDGKPYIHGRHVVEADGKKVLDMPYNNRGFLDLPIDDPAAAAQAEHVKADGLLSAAGERLLHYMSHDTQHLSRTFDAVPAAYLACDPVNRDRLVTLGSQACWRLNIYPVRRMPNFGGWGSLFGATKQVDAHPHEGIGFDRAHGWVTHSLGWAYCLSMDPQVRADCVDVAREDVYVRGKAQMAPGNVTVRSPSGKAFNGEYWFTTGWEEGAIMADGARAVVNILSSPENQGRADEMKEIYRKVGRWIATKAWSDELHSPGFHIALRKKGEEAFLEHCISSGNCAFYLGTPMTWYYELTGEKLFLDRLNEMSAPNTLAQRSMQELGNWSYALWFAEGGKLPVQAKQ